MHILGDVLLFLLAGILCLITLFCAVELFVEHRQVLLTLLHEARIHIFNRNISSKFCGKNFHQLIDPFRSGASSSCNTIQ